MPRNLDKLAVGILVALLAGILCFHLRAEVCLNEIVKYDACTSEQTSYCWDQTDCSFKTNAYEKYIYAGDFKCSGPGTAPGYKCVPDLNEDKSVKKGLCTKKYLCYWEEQLELCLPGDLVETTYANLYKTEKCDP